MSNAYNNSTDAVNNTVLLYIDLKININPWTRGALSMVIYINY